MPLQQARFRLFEERMERKKFDLLMRASPSEAGPARTRDPEPRANPAAPEPKRGGGC